MNCDPRVTLISPWTRKLGLLPPNYRLWLLPSLTSSRLPSSQQLPLASRHQRSHSRIHRAVYSRSGSAFSCRFQAFKPARLPNCRFAHFLGGQPQYQLVVFPRGHRSTGSPSLRPPRLLARSLAKKGSKPCAEQM